MPDTALLQDRAQVFVTAAEAYPAFERMVVNTQGELLLSFRIFDLDTRLRSPEGQMVGQTWSDLLADALRRGVRVGVWLSDFDPLMATDLHRGTWQSVRQLRRIQRFGDLTIHPMLHPAKVGLLPRVAYSPLIGWRLSQRRRALKAMPHRQRQRYLREVPALCDLLHGFTVGKAALFPASHHQKVAVSDGRFVYIGGLDLDERRWDSQDHDQPTQETWHDVQMLMDDRELAAETRPHITTLIDVTHGDAEPAPTRKLLRTLSRRHTRLNVLAISPKSIVSQLRSAHLEQIAESTTLIYLETQFLRDRDIARALARRAREVPDLKLIVVLPAAPEAVAFEEKIPLDARFGEFLQARAIRKLRRAFGSRMIIGSPVQKRAPSAEDISTNRATLRGSPIVYLHAKVSIFDDRAAIVSSANLNGRSMNWDTEAGGMLTDGAEVDRVRRAVTGAWLPEHVPDAAFQPSEAFPVWKAILRKNARVRPEDRKGFLVPYDDASAREDAQIVVGVPEEMV